MKRPVIHQVILGAAEGDAITQMAFSLRDELSGKCDTQIYALLQHGDLMKEQTSPLAEIPDSKDVDLLLYHSSIGWQEMTDFLSTRSEKLGVSYHNITPAHFYERELPEFAADLRLGRTELEMIRSQVVVTIADSQFNATDIESHGYENVHVVPAGFSPRRLNSEIYDLNLLSELSRRFPNGYVVAVGQILPHKRIEQLLETMHLLNSTFWGNIGLVVCGVARQVGYMEAINKFRTDCAMVDVQFTGAVTNQELSTYIRGASAYLGMSDHEGLCIPPVEAMSLGIPVVIKGAGAVPETVADGALVLPAECGPILACEALQAVLTDPVLRVQLISKGLSRVEELEARRSSSRTVELLMDVIS